MSQELSTVIVFVPFVIIAAVVIILALFWVYDRIRPLIDNFAVAKSAASGEDSDASDEHDDGREKFPRSPLRSAADWFRHLADRRRNDPDDGEEDLDDSTATLLSMLPTASMVVNREDEVIRANPAAYTLGVVDDERIVSAEVREAIRQVRESGGRRRFDLTTSTPERFVAAADRGPSGADPVEVYGVARPNWLKITVGRIDDRFVVVLIDDVSNAIRFSQVRDSFITNVSEQLLNPTQALSQLADSLQDDALDAEQISWNAHNVSAACGRLNRMVADLLLLIQAQEPVIPSSANRLNMMEQVRAACAKLEPQSERLGVQLSVTGDDALTVNGDGEQIRAAVSKLVSNAIVYSNRGGAVSVTASRSDDGTQAVVRVIDQGVGIDKDEQTRIFERFYRGTNQTPQSRDGIGLGLAIVKHVALAHHGGVAVWSSKGSGSTFSLSLPLAQ